MSLRFRIHSSLFSVAVLLSCSLLIASPVWAAGSSDAPTLAWSSKLEDGVYGYIIYRANRASGPFLRINPRIVPRNAAMDGDVNSTYRYVDEAAKPGATYYYYIDAIALSGRKQRLTEVISKKYTVAATP